jgi:hypothetical protein
MQQTAIVMPLTLHSAPPCVAFLFQLVAQLSTLIVPLITHLSPPCVAFPSQLVAQLFALAAQLYALNVLLTMHPSLPCASPAELQVQFLSFGTLMRSLKFVTVVRLVYNISV